MDLESVGNAVAVVFEWNDLKYIGKEDKDGEVGALPDVLNGRQRIKPIHLGTAAESFFKAKRTIKKTDLWSNLILSLHLEKIYLRHSGSDGRTLHGGPIRSAYHRHCGID